MYVCVCLYYPNFELQVSEALGHFYTDLKKTYVRVAWEHWDTLHVDSVRSEKLKENFRKVYYAYSPHKEEDVFVIAPWIPGPRYTSATAGKPNQPYTTPPRARSTTPTMSRSPCRSATQGSRKPMARPASVRN